jgi:hypothetical protein
MLTARVYRKEGLYEEAFKKYMLDFVDGVDREQDFLANLAKRNVTRALNEWYVHEIKVRAQAWHQAHGSWPTVEELKLAGAFRGVSLPDCRTIYGVLDQIENRQIKIPQVSDSLAFIANVVHPWEDLPPGPHEVLYPEYPGFCICPTWAKTTRISFARRPRRSLISNCCFMTSSAVVRTVAQ